MLPQKNAKRRHKPMTEHILKTTVPPPDGWEYTGEYRHATKGEWYAWYGEARLCGHFTETCVPILRRARWVPKPGEEYWFACWDKVDHTINDEMPCDLCRQEERNQWRTKEQAAAYSTARKALAERMHGEDMT
jgi:hypothetical protein